MFKISRLPFLACTTAQLFSILLPRIAGASNSDNADATAQAPVQIVACGLSPSAWMFKGGRAMPILVRFKNASNKVVTSVRIDVLEAALPKGGTRFDGAFSPGAEIKKQFLDYDAARVSDSSAVTCAVSLVQFEDGSSWHGNAASSVISDQPDAPIKIQDCSFSPLRGGMPDYNELVTLSFTNTSTHTISAAKFTFVLFDAFDNQLTTVSGTVYGHFSPNALIEPVMQGASYVYSPSSPAWRYFYGAGSSEIATSKCAVSDVRFDDGTIWKSATP